MGGYRVLAFLLFQGMMTVCYLAVAEDAARLVRRISRRTFRRIMPPRRFYTKDTLLVWREFEETFVVRPVMRL